MSRQVRDGPALTSPATLDEFDGETIATRSGAARDEGEVGDVSDVDDRGDDRSRKSLPNRRAATVSADYASSWRSRSTKRAAR
jgi:hypothetical protein